MRSALRSLPLVLLIGVLTASAADWPQWRGPARDGLSSEKGLLQQWPEGGPKLRWKNTMVGDGYSTPAVVAGKVFLLGNSKTDEYALALDVRDGKELWKTVLGAVGVNKTPPYPGARSTPTVDGDRLYVLGSAGDLACLATKDGKVVWKKNLATDFGGVMGNWAYAESVLIDGDTLVCTPGGKQATLLALNKATGEVIWKSALPEADEAGYSSVIVAEVGGLKQYIQFLQKGVVGVDAKTGRFLWRYEDTKDQAANIFTPVFHGGLLFTSSGRNKGGVIKILVTGDKAQVEPVWTSKELANSIGGMILVGDYLYGTNNTELLCVEFATGKIAWRNRSVGKGAICYADGCLYVRAESGEVALVEATPAGYREKGRFTPPEKGNKPCWPHPVVSNGGLYLRDQNFLYCYEIAK